MNDEEQAMVRRVARVVLDECGTPIPLRKSSATYGVPGWALTALELALDGRAIDAHQIILSYGGWQLKALADEDASPTEGV